MYENLNNKIKYFIADFAKECEEINMPGNDTMLAISFIPATLIKAIANTIINSKEEEISNSDIESLIQDLIDEFSRMIEFTINTVLKEKNNE